jgi:hypothetical protein
MMRPCTAVDAPMTAGFPPLSLLKMAVSATPGTVPLPEPPGVVDQLPAVAKSVLVHPTQYKLAAYAGVVERKNVTRVTRAAIFLEKRWRKYCSIYKKM